MCMIRLHLHMGGVARIGPASGWLPDMVLPDDIPPDDEEDSISTDTRQQDHNHP